MKGVGMQGSAPTPSPPSNAQSLVQRLRAAATQRLGTAAVGQLDFP